ncbi:MAG: hypothetical protein FWD13_06525 [Treponema sp.]|nr:hypothetical protein [Treponema sp.]
MYKPIVLVFAGPNGSGKSTVTKLMPLSGVYINADDIKKENNISDLEAAEQAEAPNEVIHVYMAFLAENINL